MLLDLLPGHPFGFSIEERGIIYHLIELRGGLNMDLERGLKSRRCSASKAERQRNWIASACWAYVCLAAAAMMAYNPENYQEGVTASKSLKCQEEETERKAAEKSGGA